MKKILLLTFFIEIAALSTLVGIYFHHRHYQSDRYDYVVLAQEPQSYLMGLNWQSLRSYFSFAALAEMQDITAIEYSASFCALVVTCLGEKDRQVIDSINEHNYRLAQEIIQNLAYSK